MAERRSIYVSAVSKELRSSRELVAKTLRILGYEPVWREIEDDFSGDIRAGLFSQVEECAAVVQIVGRSYGPEPPPAEQRSGRTSYAQYEALSARQCKIPVWHFITAEGFPADATPAEEPEEQRLQTTYQLRIQHHARHSRIVSDLRDLEKRIYRLRGPLFLLRRAQILRRVAIAAFCLGILIFVGSRFQGSASRATAPAPAKPAPAPSPDLAPSIPRSSSSDSLARRRTVAMELRTAGRFTEAEAELRNILKTRERFLGEEHADVIETCNDLALILRDQKNRSAALTFARRVETAIKRNPAAEKSRVREIDELIASIEALP